MKGGTETEKAKLIRILREIRENAGVRQIDLAEKLGRHQSYISKYESGEKTLDFLEVKEVCDALGMPFDKFVRYFGEE